ncbi:MAG: hypothetical protein BWX70_02161 [Verrucomicrobia bacterium ADurb.Bin070]|nr:MAG: hypothetical protein BWX70_02161 [Verrucomicrobia bacterium ADurb.Bin070]
MPGAISLIRSRASMPSISGIAMSSITPST